MNRLFVILNLALCGIALTYDLPVISTLPWWSVPFIAVCPLMPILLIAAHYVPPKYKASLAFPPAFYGIAALIFYPTYIIQNGWNWLDFGQIFWVWLYASQGWVILVRNNEKVMTPGIIYVMTSLIILYTTKSYGYLAIDQLDQALITRLFIVLLLVAVSIPWLLKRVINHQPLLNRRN